ncbi:MAG: OmpA family protein [Candidatus Eisenbacteria bacterium]|uniref:OmpA family protein n=1 Tax=Eiseniibacteriota bacterium TaxID=2212470 RepID=A0A849SHS3_UNCEI|nr:OmpA family protein [Candidatus Eisenbacteria bacterium]
MRFTLTVGVGPAAVPQVINAATVSTPGDDNPTNDRDVDPTGVPTPGQLVIEKEASPSIAEVGDVVTYTVKIRNVGQTTLENVRVTDQIPPGMRYVRGSTRLDGVRQRDPEGANTLQLTFPIGTVVPEQVRTLLYRLEIRSGIAFGTARNIAQASTPGDSTTVPVVPGIVSNVADADVKITGGPFSDEGIIVGKVFLDCDCDSNGVQGPEELGIPGVRLYLEDGTSSVTDAEGKYSFEHVRPRLHVLRADPTTLPAHATLKPLANRNALDGESRFVDLRKGELHRADFSPQGCGPNLLAEVKARRRAGEVSGPFVEGLAPSASTDAPEGIGKALWLTVSASAVPADGTSELPVRIARRPASGSVLVTLESSVGTWMVPDEDPALPGTQVAMSGSSMTVMLRASQSPADGRLRATIDGAESSLPVRFVPNLRSLLMAGLLEGRIDWRRLKTAELCSGHRDDFEDALRDASFDDDDGRTFGGARGALFAKGDIGRDFLLTLRYDSERDPDKRRFRDIRPFEGYDVFGDASVHDFAAQSSSRLYARLDRGSSYVMFGDFVTPAADARQLGAFTRTLNGGVGHIGGRLAQLTAYGTQAREHQVIDEIAARGVSGPYALSRSDGVLGTEVVEVLVRDRNQPSRVLRREPRMRFADYTLEPFSGRLLFRQPVPSVDSELNPVSIRVIYEIEGNGDGYGVYGGELTLTPSPRLTLGLAASRDEDPSASNGLSSVNATLLPWSGVTLGAEFAHSDSGGALFDGDRKSDAWRGDARFERGGFLARTYGQRVDGGFDAASSGILPGRQELGADARYQLGAASMFARYLRTEDLVADGHRDGAELGLGRRFGAWSAEAAYRWAEETATPATPGSVGTTPNDFSSVRGRLSADLPLARRSSAFGEYEVSLDDANADRWALGADTQVAPRTRLYARHESIDAFAGPFALNDQQNRATTLVGIASDELRDGYLFTEYRARDAFAGRETQAAMGVRNRWLVSPGTRVDGSIEHIETIRGGSGSATSVTSGLEYTHDPSWKGTARLEFRTESNREQWLGSLGAARKLARDWTGLARSTWFLAPDEDRAEGRSQFGIAWRQTDRNQWDALARYEHRFDKDAGDDPFERSVHILASDLNWHPMRAWTLSGKAAAKWLTDERESLTIRTDAQLFSARATVDLTPRFDLGLIGRGLYSDHFDASQTGLGVELGAILVRNLRLGVGYNVMGFSDADLGGGDRTDRGPYVRFGFKFDEGLFGRRTSPPTSAGAVPPTAVTDAARVRESSPAEPGPDALTPLRQRTTDEVIARDLAQIDAWQNRLDGLSGRARDPWRAAAARSWLDIAEIEYTDNDETGFAESSFELGRSLVSKIATGASPATSANVPEAKVLNGSKALREDLWKQLDRMKRDPNFLTAADELARLETELAWAGNEQVNQGECETVPHLKEAEDLAKRAADKLAALPPTPAVTPPAAPVAPRLPEPGLRVPSNVHFAFDECDLNAEARKVLARISSVLKLYPDARIELIGHTDARGTDAYNEGLSRCRICAVATYLLNEGIDDSRIVRTPRGESELLTPERSRYAHARNRRVETRFLDSEGRPIAMDPQEADLQIEPIGPPRRPRRPAAQTFPQSRVLDCSN